MSKTQKAYGDALYRMLIAAGMIPPGTACKGTKLLEYAEQFIEMPNTPPEARLLDPKEAVFIMLKPQVFQGRVGVVVETNFQKEKYSGITLEEFGHLSNFEKSALRILSKIYDDSAHSAVSPEVLAEGLPAGAYAEIGGTIDVDMVFNKSELPDSKEGLDELARESMQENEARLFADLSPKLLERMSFSTNEPLEPVDEGDKLRLKGTLKGSISVLNVLTSQRDTERGGV